MSSEYFMALWSISVLPTCSPPCYRTAYVFFIIAIILIMTIAHKIFAAGGFDICKTNEGVCWRGGTGEQKPDVLLPATSNGPFRQLFPVFSKRLFGFHSLGLGKSVQRCSRVTLTNAKSIISTAEGSDKGRLLQLWVITFFSDVFLAKKKKKKTIPRHSREWMVCNFTSLCAAA